MKPTESWIKDWHFGEDPNLERKVSEELVNVFKDFWVWADLDAKGMATQRRYSAALHALGGYLVEEIGNGAETSSTVRSFLKGYIDTGEGPLIYHDNEEWQNELDTACRKLYKYLTKQC